MLAFPGFNSFLDYFINTKSQSCLKFLENCFTFCNNKILKLKFGTYSEALLDMLDKLDENDFLTSSSIINILSEIYREKERRPITIAMKLVKRNNVHP